MHRPVDIMSIDNNRIAQGIATTARAESSYRQPVVVIDGVAKGPLDLPAGATVVVGDYPNEQFDPGTLLDPDDPMGRFLESLKTAGYRISYFRHAGRP